MSLGVLHAVSTVMAVGFVVVVAGLVAAWAGGAFK